MVSDNELEGVGTALRDNFNRWLGRGVNVSNTLKGRERDLIISSLYIVRDLTIDECARVAKEHKCNGNCSTSIAQSIHNLKEKK